MARGDMYVFEPVLYKRKRNYKWAAASVLSFSALALVLMIAAPPDAHPEVLVAAPASTIAASSGEASQLLTKAEEVYKVLQSDRKAAKETEEKALTAHSKNSKAVSSAKSVEERAQAALNRAESKAKDAAQKVKENQDKLNARQAEVSKQQKLVDNLNKDKKASSNSKTKAENNLKSLNVKLSQEKLAVEVAEKNSKSAESDVATANKKYLTEKENDSKIAAQSQKFADDLAAAKKNEADIESNFKIAQVGLQLAKDAVADEKMAETAVKTAKATLDTIKISEPKK